ncbi:hypothetical protein [Saccharopolyspora hattusasensis]|uniref:hypothetical protein n=1 Tax=Saccharopolyspora hattusasensis TaxID=1128679 RepID=UPI003D9703B1
MIIQCDVTGRDGGFTPVSRVFPAALATSVGQVRRGGFTTGAGRRAAVLDAEGIQAGRVVVDQAPPEVREVAVGAASGDLGERGRPGEAA